MHPSWIEIDLGQFRKNIATIRQHIGKALFCLPVKANAYGHGMVEMSKAAALAGVNYLAVAHLKEGELLRKSGIELPILVLGAIHEDQIDKLIALNLEFTISSRFKADLVAARAKQLSSKVRVHLEIDTGMQRTGVRPASAIDLLKTLDAHACFDVAGVYSHLALEGPSAREQIETFISLTESAPFRDRNMLRHIANSMGTIHFPEAHLDMVRPSLLSFGYLEGAFPSSLSDIAPCFSLKTKVSYFKVVEENVGISYGHSYKTKNKTRIVTIPIGYGDGFRRCLSNKAEVLIRGKRFKTVGTICMDQMMCDIGDSEAYVGDEAVLIGKQGNEEILLQDVARDAGTIPYEILSGFNERLPRVYVNAEDPS